MYPRLRSVTLGLLVGLVFGFAGLLLPLHLGLSPIHEPWDPPRPATRDPFFWMEVSWIAAIVGSWLLASKGRRIIGVAGGVGGIALAFLALLGRQWIDETLYVQKIEYSNQTNLFIVAYTQREGEDLSRELPLQPWESYRDTIGLRKRGLGLRIVAFDMTRDMDSTEYNNTFPRHSSRSAEQQLPFRKVFDRTFTWDELGGMGGVVSFTSVDSSP